MSVCDNLETLRDSIPAACTLIAVSKNQPEEKIREAYNCGQRHFGENRVQELTAKYESLPKDISWHMIGHLQTNKVKFIVPFVSLIHSIDSIRLLEEVNRQGLKNNRIVPCLLQVHIAREETKFGFSADEVRELLHSLPARKLAHIQVQGLMGMATFTTDQQQVRSEFLELKMLFEHMRSSALPENVTMERLSMGMTADYPLAIEAGSTMVRVGTAIFGQRERP